MNILIMFVRWVTFYQAIRLEIKYCISFISYHELQPLLYHRLSDPVHLNHVLARDLLVQPVLQVCDLLTQLVLIVQVFILCCKVFCYIWGSNLPIYSSAAGLHLSPIFFYFLKYVQTPLHNAG